MAERGFRKRCPQCGEIKIFKRKSNRVCSVACEVRRRTKTHAFARFQVASVLARKKKPVVLSGFGVLTPRELAIYRTGRHNGRVCGIQSGKRLGWAEALGERKAS